MALEAGVISITLEYAKDLKSSDWFGKQDPYCILRVGGQTFRTHTAKDGGRSPVWNETFRVNVMNENDVNLDIKDEDVGRDDLIGNANFSLARARQVGNDRQEVAVFSPKNRKQHGFVSVMLKWAPHRVPGLVYQPLPHWTALQYGSSQPTANYPLMAQSHMPGPIQQSFYPPVSAPPMFQ